MIVIDYFMFENVIYYSILIKRVKYFKNLIKILEMYRRFCYSIYCSIYTYYEFIQYRLFLLGKYYRFDSIV